MTIRKFNPGCPCCGCQYHFDDFNRSDDTDVGGNYTETAGDWSISSTALLIQSSDSQLDIDVADPDLLSSGAVFFYCYAFDDGDQVRFIFDFVDDDNYRFIQLTIGPSGSLSIVERESGSNQTLISVEANAASDAFHGIYVYWGVECNGEDSYITAISIPFSGGERVDVSTGIDGSFSVDGKALATGSITTAVFFDELYLWQHKSSTNEECPCNFISCIPIDYPFNFDDQPNVLIEEAGVGGYCSGGTLTQSLPFSNGENPQGARWEAGTHSNRCKYNCNSLLELLCTSVNLNCYPVPGVNPFPITSGGPLVGWRQWALSVEFKYNINLNDVTNSPGGSSEPKLGHVIEANINTNEDGYFVGTALVPMFDQSSGCNGDAPIFYLKLTFGP